MDKNPKPRSEPLKIYNDEACLLKQSSANWQETLGYFDLGFGRVVGFKGVGIRL